MPTFLMSKFVVRSKVKLKRYPFSRQISILYRQELKIVTPLLEPYGITFSQLPFIMKLYAKNGISQDELVSYVNVDKAIGTRVLKQLEESSLIIRKPNPNDARSKLVYFTEKALLLEPSLLKVINEWNELLTIGLSEQDLKSLERINKQIIQNVNQK